MKDELQGLFTYETMFYVVNVLDGLKINAKKTAKKNNFNLRNKFYNIYNNFGFVSN